MATVCRLLLAGALLISIMSYETTAEGKICFLLTHILILLLEIMGEYEQMIDI